MRTKAEILVVEDAADRRTAVGTSLEALGHSATLLGAVGTLEKPFTSWESDAAVEAVLAAPPFSDASRVRFPDVD